MMKKTTALLKGTRMETGNPIPISMKGTKGTQFFSFCYRRQSERASKSVTEQGVPSAL